MEPVGIVLRAVFVYAYLVCAVRVSGKKVVSNATPVDFVLALVFADLVDNAIWAEAPVAQFVAASGTIVAMRLVLAAVKVRTRLVPS